MDDLLAWILAGLAAGGLGSAAEPGQPLAASIVVALAGLSGAVLGGWLWSLLFGSGPATFLGSALFGVSAALAALAALRRVGGPRYDA